MDSLPHKEAAAKPILNEIQIDKKERRRENIIPSTGKSINKDMAMWYSIGKSYE